MGVGAATLVAAEPGEADSGHSRYYDRTAGVDPKLPIYGKPAA
jgi:hypothetical protein